MVTAIGAVTSVGLDAVTTCASIRAGISRPESLAEHEILSLETMTPVGVTGHPITLVTRGFLGVGRWLQMAALALDDLCRAAGLPQAACTSFWDATQCYVVLPYLDVERAILEVALRSEQAVAQALLEPLKARVARRCSLARSTVWCRGRLGVLEAVEQAAQHLTCRDCERVIVLAVDSLTDSPGLALLAEARRLKDDYNPVGLAPGEAAVALMLEAPRSAEARSAEALGVIEAVASAPGQLHDSEHQRAPGEELARVVKEVLGACRPPHHRVTTTIADLNGEQWRAEAYGHAQVRIAQRSWDGDAVELPATCVGDLGAAMAALQIMLACRALHRGYATGDRILLTVDDDNDYVGAAVVGKR
ncbi:MAG: hypothetical protein AAGF11_20435 [Myxococcota bacterium]